MIKKKKPSFLQAVGKGIAVTKEKVKAYQADAPRRAREKHEQYLESTRRETERLKAKASLLRQRKEVEKLSPAPQQFGIQPSAFMFGSAPEPAVKRDPVMARPKYKKRNNPFSWQ